MKIHNSVTHRAAVILTLAGGVCMTLTGCVSQQKYDEVVVENQKLKEEKMRLSVANLSLSADLAVTSEEADQLKRTQQQLTDDVNRWTTLGAVKMELLANGLDITLPQDVLFSTGTAELKADGQRVIGELSQELVEVPYQIVVIGYTDNVPIGPSLASRYPSNWELAGARAAAVVRAMIGDGIPPAQLIAVSTGDTRPIASNDTAEGRAQNRRIEVRLRPVIAH